MPLKETSFNVLERHLMVLAPMKPGAPGILFWDSDEDLLYTNCLSP